MEWLKNLSRAIDYIEDNLTGKISYADAAGIACCSPFYFQRMFSYVAGISLSEYIRRRRMTAAAFDLQTSDIKVMDAALRYGYESPTSFNRAFRRVHGVAPTAARTGGTPLNAYPPLRFSLTVTGGESLRYRIEEKEAFRIAGVRTSLEEEAERNFRIAPRFWEETGTAPVLSRISGLNNRLPEGVLGVTAYRNPGEIYYYIAAATDSRVPKDLLEYQIPAASWVIFECGGRLPESVQTVFRRFYREWLPFSGYEYAGLPDIEVYPPGSGSPGNGKPEVWIALKKHKS